MSSQRLADRAGTAASTSSTTWYWLSWVNMVEIWRWPKASYSVLSIVCGVMPRREAVSRSITRCASRPLVLLVARDVAQLGQRLELVDQSRRPGGSARRRSGSSRLY